MLSLDGMPGQQSATTDDNGAFTAAFLVFPSTAPGPRLLHATVGLATPSLAVEATARYLVVPGTLQPPDFAVRN